MRRWRKLHKKFVTRFVLAAITGILIIANQYASARGIIPALVTMSTVSNTSGTSYGTWNEIAPQGWGDPDNVYIALFRTVIAGANETGFGAGLNGANLVLTQAGGVAGATGSGANTNRPLDGLNDRFSWTVAAIQAFLDDATFTFVWKFNALENQANDYFSVTADGAHYIYTRIDATQNLTLYFADAGGAKSNQSTNTVPAAAGDIYFAIWSDGTNIRAGWSTTKPTKLSDFAANDRCTINHTSAIVPAQIASSNPIACGVNYPTGNVYYFIASKKCEIDNAS